MRGIFYLNNVCQLCNDVVDDKRLHTHLLEDHEAEEIVEALRCHDAPSYVKSVVCGRCGYAVKVRARWLELGGRATSIASHRCWHCGAYLDDYEAKDD